MSSPSFDFAPLLHHSLPAPAAAWTGFPAFNFVGGHNDADSIPVADLLSAAGRVIAREGSTLATYGLSSGPLGYAPLRAFIAAKLAADASVKCSAEEVLITSGSLQGLDLVNRILLNPGDTVIVEQASYGGALNRLRGLGVKFQGVPLDHDGLRADALRSTLEALRARGVRPKYIYCIPTVQNPTATVMSEARRREILDLSEHFGVPVFEDECYADLTWSGARPPAMRAMAGAERVIHIGSFSKSVAPALRLGYLVADWPVMSRILSVKNDGGAGALDQMILGEYCLAHFNAHLPRLRATLRAKLDCLQDSLREAFGDQAQFDDPAGGIFQWVTLPEAVDTSRLAQVALQSGVAINPGAEWTSDGDSGRHRLRLCFAHPSKETIREGVLRLAEICRREFGLPHQATPKHR